MFKKLQNKIIIITMSITTAILIIAGVSIMLFSSTMRPGPEFHPEPDFNMPNPALYDSQTINTYIKNDRKEGDMRLLVSLLCVGVVVEVVAFIISFLASRKIVEPVKDSYDKQKLFIANASHELKTPLAIIQANMEALDVDKDNEKWKANIENEISHANKLVLDLLQLAKMDAGSIAKNKPEKVDLKTEIEKRIEMFKPKFGGEIIFKTTNYPKNFSLVKQDFLQILDILLDNATKYGNKKISIILKTNSIAILNDGATIPKNDQKKVFERFYQTDKTKEGSGLGLSIAKALCEQNGWNISCEKQNKDTKFILTFKHGQEK